MPDEVKKRTVPAAFDNSLYPKEEIIARARKGGQASMLARKRRKMQREVLEQVMTLPYSDEERRAKMIEMGLSGDYIDAINLGVADKAAKGDVDAARYIRDTLGEKPVDRSAISLVDRPIETLDMSSLSDEELDSLAELKE